MTFTELSMPIFEQAINDYHKYDNVDQPIENPYEVGTIEYYLYLKNWIDTVQWHFEDIIREPDIDPVEGIKLKRRIDKSNQDRTDLVEMIDSYFLDKYKDVQVFDGATINTESLHVRGHPVEERGKPLAGKDGDGGVGILSGKVMNHGNEHGHVAHG